MSKKHPKKPDPDSELAPGPKGSMPKVVPPVSSEALGKKIQIGTFGDLDATKAIWASIANSAPKISVAALLYDTERAKTVKVMSEVLKAAEARESAVKSQVADMTIPPHAGVEISRLREEFATATSDQARADSQQTEHLAAVVRFVGAQQQQAHKDRHLIITSVATGIIALGWSIAAGIWDGTNQFAAGLPLVLSILAAFVLYVRSSR